MHRVSTRSGPDLVSFLARTVWWSTGRLAKVTAGQTNAPRSGASRCKTLRASLFGHAADAGLAAKLVGAGRDCAGQSSEEENENVEFELRKQKPPIGAQQVNGLTGQG